MKEHATAMVNVFDQCLTSGELEQSMAGNPLADMMVPMIRGQMEAKKAMYQRKSEMVEDMDAQQTRGQLDVNSDGRVKKAEFLANLENTLFLEQKMGGEANQQAVQVTQEC